MIKKLLVASLICLSTANAFAVTHTIKASENGDNEINPWIIATKDDGYFQILGLYDNKKFIVQVSPLHNGKPADALTINCNSGNGNFETHTVAAGATITCYPHYHDVVSMYINPNTFTNGSEGIYTYEPYTPPKTN